jgi:hypothetical protein
MPAGTVAISWTAGAPPDAARLEAALAVAFAGGAPEVSLAPPPIPPPLPLSVSIAPRAAVEARPDDDGERAGFHDRPRLVNPYVAPRDEVEQAVAAIWRRALGIDRIGVDDNFLELGGDSLTGLQVAHAVAEQWELDGRAFSLYETPTVASSARWIAGSSDGRGGARAATERSVSRGERRRAQRTAARRTES